MHEDVKRVFLLTQQYLCSNGYETRALDQEANRVSATLCFDARTLEVVVDHFAGRIVRVYAKSSFWSRDVFVNLSECRIIDVSNKGSLLRLETFWRETVLRRTGISIHA